MIFAKIGILKTRNLYQKDQYFKKDDRTKMKKYIRFLFIRNTFISKARLKLAKNQANASNTLRLNFSYLTIIHILHRHNHPKIIAHILKNKQKSKRVFIHQITRSTIIKIKTKMKNRSHGYGKIRPSLDMGAYLVSKKVSRYDDVYIY